MTREQMENYKMMCLTHKFITLERHQLFDEEVNLIIKQFTEEVKESVISSQLLINPELVKEICQERKDKIKLEQEMLELF